MVPAEAHLNDRLEADSPPNGELRTDRADAESGAMK